jgi:hypothetical protein
LNAISDFHVYLRHKGGARLRTAPREKGRCHPQIVSDHSDTETIRFLAIAVIDENLGPRISRCTSGLISTLSIGFVLIVKYLCGIASASPVARGRLTFAIPKSINTRSFAVAFGRR